MGDRIGENNLEYPKVSAQLNNIEGTPKKSKENVVHVDIENTSE
jgi:hypothetical protein